MAEFRKLGAGDVGEILTAFQAGSYRAHQPIAVGTINTNVRVETDARTLFLRVNEGKSLDDVRREAAIVEHAMAHGVRTPAPLHTRAGLPFLEWKGEIVSLFPWFPGRTLTRDEVLATHAAQVGEALARLHLSSPTMGDHSPGRYEPDEIARRFRQISALARPELAGAVQLLGPELERLAEARAGAVPTGVIHGDLFIDNVLFEDDPVQPRLSALLDFEQASWGRLAYDLAVTTLAFGYGRDDFRPEIVRALIDAYVAVRPPAPEEAPAFGAELCFVACRFAVTRITDVHLKRTAGAAPGKRFQRYLDRLASVKKHLAAGDGLFAL